MGDNLRAIGEGIWIVDCPTVRFYGMPFPTRMTVIRLADGSLFIHSPEKLDDDLRRAVEAKGEVRHLVSPNKLHHLFLADWLAAFPQARSYAAPGLPQKRPDLHFDVLLSDQPEAAWADEIDQLLFRGSPVMDEVVFFHCRSATLIVTDLIENFAPASLNIWQRGLARIGGVLAPHGSTPSDWRLTFRFGQPRLARQAAERIVAWQPRQIVLAHGLCVFEDAPVFLQQALAWALPH